MSTPDPGEFDRRIAELERQVQALRARVEWLEQSLTPRLDHPVDRATVREKVAYDWQA